MNIEAVVQSGAKVDDWLALFDDHETSFGPAGSSDSQPPDFGPEKLETFFGSARQGAGPLDAYDLNGRWAMHGVKESPRG